MVCCYYMLGEYLYPPVQNNLSMHANIMIIWNIYVYDKAPHGFMMKKYNSLEI